MAASEGQTGEPPVRIVLIDDDVEVSAGMARLLRPHGFTVTTIQDPAAGLEYLALHGDDVDVILLDVDMPEMSGLEVLRRLKQADGPTPVVMWTGDARALTATTAMRAGAFSYTTKPVARTDELLALLHSAASYCRLNRKSRALERRVRDAEATRAPIGESAAMRALRERVDRLAQSDVTVLVLGESGTGKELVARAIHEHSGRARKPFVAINCGAISESLIDSELFGHVRGAFTGADSSRPGVFVEANGGTLFLDEIGELPVPIQARLLRVLQEREVRPVGGAGVTPVDVRIVAATQVDLDEAVERNRFRADLFYRLNVGTIVIPPLHARIVDVPLLAAHFLHKHAHPRVVRLTAAALDALMAYAWPGNVRELENALLYALALSSTDTIEATSLPAQITSIGADLSRSGLPSLPTDLEWVDGLSLVEAKKRVSDEFERRYVTRMMVRARGNLTEAARLAGLDRSNFRRILTRLGVDTALFRSS